MPLRVFIAIRVKYCNRLAVVVEELDQVGRAVQCVSSQNLHLTLQFLGDIKQEALTQIAAAITLSVQGIEAFSFKLVGLGVFPDIRRPSVIWTGIDDGGQCVTIVRRLASNLKMPHVDRQIKPFQPHITIARVKSRPPSRLAEIVDAQKEQYFGEQHVTCIELIRSKLRPSGPSYTTIWSTQLRSGSKSPLAND